MGFRKDINGLRAIAVVAVVLFHFNVAGFAGGFVGVDVFFVISGYLMTSIIFPKVASNTFSLWEFYLARARRIVPALAALCCFYLVVGWLLLLPNDFATLGKHIASALLFVSNIIFNREAGYFDVAPFDKWLLHTWSLSVEWQFYMLYPALVMLLFRLAGIRLAKVAVLAGCVASLGLSAYAVTRWPGSTFYLLPTRAWELLAGGIVFLYPLTLPARAMKLIEVAGMAAIGYACWRFSGADAWPGFLAAVPVLGTMMVLWAKQGDSIFTGTRASNILGDWSYSIYLWHWPIVVGLHYSGNAGSMMWMLAGVVASIIAGWASYTLIESTTRVKRSSEAPRPLYTALVVVSPALAVALALTVVFLNGVPSSVRSVNDGERAQFVEHYRQLHESGLVSAYRAECDFYDWKTKHAKNKIDASCTEADTPMFLWGDSHAQALSLGLRTLVGEKSVAQVATSGCPPDIDGKSPAQIDNNCVLSNQFALSEIARLRPAVVILAQHKSHASKDWQRLAERVRSLGAGRVVLVGPAPEWRPALPMLVARNHWLDASEFINDGIHANTLADNVLLGEKFKNSTGLSYVSITNTLCRPDGSCRAFLPGTRELIAVDYGHLSPKGSIYVVQQILATELASIKTAGLDGRRAAGSNFSRLRSTGN
jgi:peptidoglycan/LPS O-acetylase OafA/YrhL